MSLRALAILILFLSSVGLTANLNFPLTNKRSFCTSVLTASRAYERESKQGLAVYLSLGELLFKLDQKSDEQVLKSSFEPVYFDSSKQTTQQDELTLRSRVRALYRFRYPYPTGHIISLKGQQSIQSFLNDISIAYQYLAKVDRKVGRRYLKMVEQQLHLASWLGLAGATIHNPELIKYLAPLQLGVGAVTRTDLVIRGMFENWLPKANIYISHFKKYLDREHDDGDFIYWADNYLLPETYLSNRLNPQSALIPSRQEQSRQLHGWVLHSNGLNREGTKSVVVEQSNNMYNPIWIGIDFYMYQSDGVPVLNIIINFEKDRPPELEYPRGESLPMSR